MTALFRAVVIVLAVAVGGCGSASGGSGGPAQPVSALLRELSRGDVAAVCVVLAPQAVSQLRRDFGGSSCPTTVGAVARYVRSRPRERSAIASAQVLVPTDLPFSPAPYRLGADVERVRVQFYDPVLQRVQALDLSVRRSRRGWVVDSGASGLFTLL
jgi:hypothetical protein